MENSNLIIADQDKTLAYLNNYLQPGQNISQNVNDAIIGYFERIADNKVSARAKAAAVIATATSQGLNAIELLESFKTLNNKELNDFVVKFLNYKRKETSFLGMTNKKVDNKYILRLIKP